MNDLVHAFRPTIFSREVRFRLTDAALETSDGETSRSVAYADIASVRIYRQPGAGFGPAIRRAVLGLATGGNIVLQSNHYVRFGVVEDRAAGYRTFVAALLERVASANPRARVTIGHSWLAWTMWLTLLVGSLAVLLLGVVMIVRQDFPLAALLYIGIVAAMLPVTWRVVSTSRPRPGDLRALPAGTLD